MEPLIERKLKGPKGTVEGAASAAAESHLHEKAYQESELEGIIGKKLTDLFQGNESQLRSIAFANKHGKASATPQCQCKVWQSSGNQSLSHTLEKYYLAQICAQSESPPSRQKSCLCLYSLQVSQGLAPLFQI